MTPKSLFSLAASAFTDWREDKAARLAAALAYYTVFALAPLLVLVIGIAGLVFGREAAQGQVVRELQGLLGRDAASVIQETVENAAKTEASGLAAAGGLLLLLLGASGVFGQLKDGLNTIWEVAPRPGRGILGMLKDRFASFTMVLGVGFLLLVSLAVSAGVGALGERAGTALDASPVLAGAVHFVISFGVITLLFAMIYRVLPDVEIRWSDVWLGAASTALLFTLGKFLIGLYLGSGNAGSAFGAAGGLVILLLWVYYSAQILFLGAELTQVYANRYGSRIVPDEDAVAVTEDARAQQGMPGRERVAAGTAAQRRQTGTAPDRGRSGTASDRARSERRELARPADWSRRKGRETPGTTDGRQYRDLGDPEQSRGGGDRSPADGRGEAPGERDYSPAGAEIGQLEKPSDPRFALLGAGFMAALIAYAAVKDPVPREEPPPREGRLP